MKTCQSNRLAVPVLIFSVLIIASLACNITMPTFASKVSSTAPAPTGLSVPTGVASSVAPAPTTIYVAPDDLTVRGSPQDDFLWGGMTDKGHVLSFCVNRTQVDMIRIVSSMTCRDKQTREQYSYWVLISFGEEVPFLLEPDGRINGEYTIPDGVYKDVEVGILARLQGAQGRVWIDLKSDNEVAVCEQTVYPFEGIDVKRSNAPCVR